MSGMVTEAGPKFYLVPFPTQKVTQNFYIKVCDKCFTISVVFFFCKACHGFNQLWRDNRAFSKILCSPIPIPVHDLKIKVTDFEFFFVC